MNKQAYIKKKVGKEWLPLYIVTRQKSQLKKLFQKKEELSNAFLVGAIPYFETIGKGIEDSTFTFISFSGKQDHEADTEELTGCSVMEFMLMYANQFFTLPRASTYVIAFDKKKYVPENKREKQLRENLDDSSEVHPFEWDPKSNEHVLEYDKPIPCSWSSLKLNREARAQAMRDVVYMMKDYYRPPAGKRLIIDSDTFEAPLVIATTLGGVAENYLDFNLQNTIGEADNAIMYYVSAFSNGTANVDAHKGGVLDRPCWNGEDTDDILVRSKDTDVWLTLMLQYERRYNEGDFANRVIVCTGNTTVTSTEGSKTVIDSTCPTPYVGDDPFIAAMANDESPVVIRGTVAMAPTPSQRVTDSEQFVSRMGAYIDINSLFDGAASKLITREGSVLPHCLESLFVVSIMGGNDYVDGYYGLSYDVLLKTWFKFHQDIGCLVEFNDIQGRNTISITPSHYLRLLINAYYQAYEKRSITNPKTNPTKRKPKPHFPEGAPQNLTLTMMSNIVRKLKASYPDKWIPSCEDIGHRLRRTEWYLRYCYYAWLSKPETHVPNPLNHGWEYGTVRYRTYLGRTGELTMLTRKVTLKK